MTQQIPFGIRLESDAVLPGSVESVSSELSVPFCDISGFGELAWVMLATDDAEKIVYLEGPFQLLTLNGRLRQAGDMTLVDFVCTLSRQTDNGIQVLGGKLIEAQVSFVELTCTPLAVLEVETTAAVPSSPIPATDAQKSPAAKISAPSQATRKAPENALDSRWASAVKEASRLQRDSDFLIDDGRDVRPSRGDIVQHLQFGECKVTRIGDDHITLRKPDGRNVQLGLQILRFFHQGKQDERDVFRVEVNRKH